MSHLNNNLIILATIYLIGGNNGISDVETLMLDNSTFTQKRLPHFPFPISQAIGAVFNDEILVCGGYNYPGIFKNIFLENALWLFP